MKDHYAIEKPVSQVTPTRRPAAADAFRYAENSSRQSKRPMGQSMDRPKAA